MPRKRKTSSGADAQGTPASVPGVRYGEGVEHQQLARALPAADMRSTEPGAGAMSPAPAPGGGRGAPLDPALLSQLMQGAPIGALRASARPNEPVTAGIPSGPGPGPLPTARGLATPLGRTLVQLYQATGDPTFMRLAHRAGVQ